MDGSMTHTQPMSEGDGTFTAEGRTRHLCRKCEADEVTVKLWESSCGGYEDARYNCAACGHIWWVDGADA